MALAFTKMHGLGNDFIVIDNTDASVLLTTERIKALSDRKFGVGCDQLLVVEAPSVADAEFDYRIYNADGLQVEHCGNGARCFAKFLRDRKMSQSTQIRVNTVAGVLTLKLHEDDRVTVKMGVPEFNPAQIPLLSDVRLPSYSLDIDKQKIEFGAVAIGNPHAVLLVDNVNDAPVNSLGPLIEKHPHFPRRVNVGFMQIIDRGHIRLRVFERGVGETQACGTGACAAVVIGCQKKLLDKSVIVTLSGGDLEIYWAGEQHNVEMTGPCTTVFEGQTEM